MDTKVFLQCFCLFFFLVFKWVTTVTNCNLFTFICTGGYLMSNNVHCNFNLLHSSSEMKNILKWNLIALNNKVKKKSNRYNDIFSYVILLLIISLFIKEKSWSLCMYFIFLEYMKTNLYAHVKKIVKFHNNENSINILIKSCLEIV